MPRTFEPNPGFAAELFRTETIRELLQDRVDAGARRAAELAPDDPATTGNDLRSSIEGEVDMTARGWAGRVVAGNFKAEWYEQGTVRQGARPFLRPAVEEEIGPIEAVIEGES